MRFLIATDTGGTFTDVAVHDTERGEVLFGKALTQYGALVEGVMEAIDGTDVPLADSGVIKHGTTQVINTFLQRSGAKTALVTTRGFRDSLEIGRASRPVPFVLSFRRDPPLAPRRLCYEITERLDAKGNVITPLAIEEVDALAATLAAEKVEAIAVSLINAYANPSHEQQVADRLRVLMPNVFVTTATEISGEWYEYERTSTAVANAYVGARMDSYTRTFETRLSEKGFEGSFYMMGSNGGLLSVEQAVTHPVALVESGPVGGCIGTGAYADALGINHAIAFDMGGTTAKCALIENGRFDIQPTYYVGGYERGFPIRTAVLDIIEVGAGGGTIAWLDAHGRLRFGPQSAGSEPGPVAFGRGGEDVTVTDANVILGRIGGGAFLNGDLSLDIPKALAVVQEKIAAPLGYTDAEQLPVVAQGIIDLATATMAGAIKEITIERGHDVRDFSLFAFGGGGPLFASELAKELGIPSVIIPPQPGNFSSIGMLLADARIDLVQTHVANVTAEALKDVKGLIQEMQKRARDALAQEFSTDEIHYEPLAEMRYRGQMHSVRVQFGGVTDVADALAGFNTIYAQRYGLLTDDRPIEIIGLRLIATIPADRPSLESIIPFRPGGSPEPTRHRDVYFRRAGKSVATPVYDRASLPPGFQIEGPAVIEEFSSTTILMPEDTIRVGHLGELHLTHR